MQNHGRRAGFTLGALCMILAGILCALAIYSQQFWLMCLGMIAGGAAIATFQFFRFAALDVAPAGWESRAISWVLAGGLLAAFMGPNLAIFTRNLISTHPFSASYLAAIPISLLILFLITRMDLPKPKIVEVEHIDERPTRDIIKQPTFIVAVVSATFAYGIMNLLMTATPISMQGCGFDFPTTANVIQWHIVGMFLPSFFTGNLIKRVGVLPIMLTGAGLLGGVVAINLDGQTEAHYWSALVMLGVGWNFLFIGGTTLLATTYRLSEKGKVQGINDTLVFSLTALTAFSSGYLHDKIGWQAMNWLTVPFIMLAASLVLGLILLRRYGRV